jgi:hypothetical protein
MATMATKPKKITALGLPSRNGEPKRSAGGLSDALDFDLFEQAPDGSLMWKGQARGLASARRKLSELAKNGDHPYLAIHVLTEKVVARAKPRGRGRATLSPSRSPSRI